MSQEVQGMLIQLEATTAQFRREMASADQVVARTTRQIDRQLSQVDSAFDRTAQKAQQAGNLMRGAFAAIAGAGLIGGILKQVDAVGQMSDRLRAATGSAAEYNLVQDRLLQTAKQTYRPLAEAQELYIRTADVIKSLGYNTQQTLDITDSFSYLLVTNAASADKAGNALNSYSKSLQTGKIDADSWQSILAAMPTVVDAVAQATGKSTDEIRRLGVQGKLSLDDLNKGFLDTVKANEEAAARMRASIGDALININTALGVYLGRAEDSTGAAGALADALGVVANNIDVVVAAGAGLAVAGITGRFYDMAKASGEATLAFAKEALAAKANAAAKLESATANAAATAAALEEARARAVNAEATHVEAVAHVELLKVRQNEIAFQAALAKGSADEARTSTALAAINLELAAAKKAVVAASGQQATTSKLVESAMAADAAATTVAAKAKQAYAASSSVAARAGAAMVAAGKGVLAFLGGPVGVAMLAGGAAAAFLLLGDNADTASSKLPGLTSNLDQVRDAFQKLGRAEREVELARLSKQIDEEKERALKIREELREEFATSLYGASGNRLPTADAEAALGRLGKAMAQSQQGVAVDWFEIAQSMQGVAGISQALVEKVLAMAAAQEESSRTSGELSERFRVLTQLTEENTAAAEGNAAAQNKLSKEAEDYIATLKKRTAALEDGNDPVKQATRHIQEHGKYTKEEADAILEEARANKAASEARTAAAEATQKALAATKAQTDAIDALIAKYDTAAKAQAEYEKGIELADEALRKNKYTTEQYQKVVQGLYTDLNKPIWDKHNKAVDEAKAKLKQLDDQLDAVRDRLEPARVATRRLADEKKLLKEALDNNLISLEEYRLRLQQLDAEYEQNTRATSDWAKWTEGALDRVDSAFADAWRNIGDGFSSFRDSLTNAFKQMLAELAHMAITKPIIMQIGAAMGVGNGTQGNNGIWGGLLGGGSSSGGGYGIQDGLSTVSAARNAYSLYSVGLAGMANTWGGYLAGAGNMLGMTSLGNFGIGMQGATLAPGLAGPTTVGASGSMGAGAQVGSGLSGMGGLMANPATWIAAGMLASAKFYDAGYRLDTEDVARQKANKMSFAIDPALSGLLNLGVKTTELATKLLGGGKLANILTGGSFIAGITSSVNKALFGGDWKTKDYGVGLSIADGDFRAQQFEYRKKKGGLFSSSKKKTIWRDLDPETAAALQETYDATEAGVSDLLARIGVSVTDGAYDGLEIARRQISTKGKTEEEISAAISEWFSFAAGRMIAEIDQGIGGFGYSLEELTQRINVFEGVNDSLELINVAVLDLSAHSMELANGMAEAAGGMDAFSAGISAYYGSFFSAAEQQEKVFASLVETFAEAEQVLAASRQDYRDMVEAIDVTTEAGRNLFNTLMGLATQADAYYDILESRAAEAINAAGAAFSGLQAAINAEVGQLQTQYQAAQASANGLLQLSNSLQSALRSMRMESDAFDQARRKQAQAQLTGALAFGRAGGDLTTLDLSGSLSELGRDSTQFYGTFEEYARDYWRTANDINSLDKLTGDQLSVEEKTLEAIEGQFAYFDQMLLDAQNQLNALMGIDTSVMSVAAALANFRVAVGAAEAAKNAAAPKTAKQTIADTYQSVFGRDAGSGEVNYWLQRIGEGTATTGNLADLFKTSDEYKSKVPAFASGGFHAGGLRLVGENGPELEVTGPSRIYNASQTAAMLGGGDSTAAITSLQRTVEGQSAALRSIAKHAMQTAKRVEFLERWDFDGLPKERGAA